MKPSFTWAARALLAGLLAAAGAAWAGKAHEHGAVRLDLVLAGGELTLDVEMPQDSLLGYERAPRTDAERKAAAAALARLRDGGSLFRLDAGAACVLASAEVRAPVLQPPAGGAVAKGAHPGPDAGGHADVDATYVFRCAQPPRLAALEVLLFDAFKRIERIDVQAVLPQGQRKAVLRPAARVLRLAR